MKNVEKKCAVCSNTFSGNEVKCPKCGCGVFETIKKQYKMESESKSNSMPVEKPKQKKGWLERLGFKRSSERAGQKEIKCAVCGNLISKDDYSCKSCSSVPIHIKSIRKIGLLLVTHHVEDDEEANWWAEDGCWQAFISLNPILSKTLATSYSHVKSQTGALLTNDDLDHYKESWLEKAQSLVQITDGDSIMYQMGGALRLLPSGVSRKIYLIVIITYRKPKNQDPDIRIVSNDRQIFPI